MIEWVAEEVRSQALELLDRVGGVEGAGGAGWVGGGRLCMGGGEVLGDQARGGVGGGVGGVDDLERVAEGCQNAADGRLEQRVVGAAEQQGVGVGSGGQG